MILCALKAGRPFVPIDSEFPLLRIQHVLVDAATKLILSAGSDSKRLQFPDGFHVPVINVDAASEESACRPGVAEEVSPDSLAYIIYTSGSTGAPKGVMQTRRNLLHHVRNYANGLRISPTDRLTHFFSCIQRLVYGRLLIPPQRRHALSL